ncbi:MAG: putative collagen-binding domain-containing protein [Armatimonadota bacterium]|nr:putative collagen-binding domain-containing protein [Armatimonadota bacterium]
MKITMDHVLAVSVWVVMALAASALSASAAGGHIKVHSSNRYFQDAAGKPIFLLGAYTWASVAPDYYNNGPQKYADMIVKGAPNKINYLRLSLGINQFSVEGGDPKWSQSHDGRPTPVPFKYVNGKADLDQWDPLFWDGLKYHCELAKKHNFIVHICLFDAVDFRPGDSSWRWPNSFWNVKNQVRDFYGNLDSNSDGHADRDGDFYRVKDFINNTGVGYYQHKLIDKALAETAKYDNVFYEIGNELLGSRADWNAELTRYISSKTGKAITQSGGRNPWNVQGFTEHNPNIPADVKNGLVAYAGQGCPFWYDPDGSDLMDGGPDALRRAIWYSLTGGAAGWGGFGASYSRRNTNSETPKYYKLFAEFMEQAKPKFWEMVPYHELVSNSAVNSCLAKIGSEYVVYVLNDDSVTLDLNKLTGQAKCKLYDPRTGAWSGEQMVSPGSHTFAKPSGAEDWVIHVVKTGV